MPKSCFIFIRPEATPSAHILLSQLLEGITAAGCGNNAVKEHESPQEPTAHLTLMVACVVEKSSGVP